MNLLSKIWRRMFRSQSTEDEAMPEEDIAVAPVVVAAGVPTAAVAAAPDAEAAKFVDAPLQTDTLRDLLKALGHDIGDVWDDVVKLAKKAI